MLFARASCLIAACASLASAAATDLSKTLSAQNTTASAWRPEKERWIGCSYDYIYSAPTYPYPPNPYYAGDRKARRTDAVPAAYGSSAAGSSPSEWEFSCVISPKVLIISLFEQEADVWYNIPDFNVLALNITVPGLSPLFPQVHCTGDGEICQVTLGEAEINAAVSITALWRSGNFDLTKTYLFTAGIAGVNPEVATTGSVTFAKYAVQVALQYEIDAREIPANFSTGYIPQGSKVPFQYPQTLYGTEVFELNDNLRRTVAAFAATARLNDTAAAQAYRANYASNPLFTAGASPPKVVLCDVATADTFYSGVLLSESFGNYSRVVTNGSAIYCTTAQEDNAIHESLLRATKAGKADFSRIITMRTCSDFDRQYPGQAAFTNLLYADPGGFGPAIRNIYLAGIKVIWGIIENWDEVFERGIKPTNYIGDIFGTLGGVPDFGPGPIKEPQVLHWNKRRSFAAKYARM